LRLVGLVHVRGEVLPEMPAAEAAKGELAAFGLGWLWVTQQGGDEGADFVRRHPSRIEEVLFRHSPNCGGSVGWDWTSRPEGAVVLAWTKRRDLRNRAL